MMMDSRMWLSLKLIFLLSGSLFRTVVDSSRLDYNLNVDNRSQRLGQREEGNKPIRKLEIQTTFKPASCILKTQVNDKLAVTYVGTFPDTGKRFDASEDPNKPFVFQVGVGKVIKGWDQGMLNMCEGEKRILKIPSELAYGHGGAGDEIPPDSPLMFQVELIKILSRKYETTTKLKKLVVETIYKPTSCSIKSKTGDLLAMIYVGTLRSTGLQFDASKDPKQPLKFKLGTGEVIKGWDEGLKDMCIGEKRRLLIPASMAYGAGGYKSSDPPIPANADLVFDTELVDIRPHQSDAESPWISTWLWLVVEASITLLETLSIFL